MAGVPLTCLRRRVVKASRFKTTRSSSLWFRFESHGRWMSVANSIHLFHGYLGNSRNSHPEVGGSPGKLFARGRYCFITKYILVSMLHVIRIPLDRLQLFPQH